MPRPESSQQSFLGEARFSVRTCKGQATLGASPIGIDDPTEAVEPQVPAENDAAIRRAQPSQGVRLREEGMSPLLEPAHGVRPARGILVIEGLGPFAIEMVKLLMEPATLGPELHREGSPPGLFQN